MEEIELSELECVFMGITGSYAATMHSYYIMLVVLDHSKIIVCRKFLGY